MNEPISDQKVADVIAAQAGRMAALIEAVAALIETHPDPLAFRTRLLDQVSKSPLGALEEGMTEPMLRGHREVTNFLAAAVFPALESGQPLRWPH